METTYETLKAARAVNHDYPDQPLHSRFRLIAENIPAGSSVLDIGCGSGTMMKALANKGCTVTGIDLAPGAVERAKTKGLNVVRADIDEMSAETERLLFAPYDAVIFSKVLQYLRAKNGIMGRLNARRVFVHQRNRGHWRALLNGEETSGGDTPYYAFNGDYIENDSIASLRWWGESYGYSSRVLSGSFFRGKDCVIEFTRFRP